MESKIKMADAGAIVEGVKEKASDPVAGAAELAGQAKDKVQEWAVATGDQAQDLGKELTKVIRRYPLPALLVGLGIGFLAGKIIRS